MLDKTNWHIPEFMGAPFQLLLREADMTFSQYKQWKDNPEQQLHYWTALETLVSLLEHVTVFHKGLGYTEREHSLIKRYESFSCFKRTWRC